MKMRRLLFVLLLAAAGVCASPGYAADNPAPMGANELAARLSALRQESGAYVRARMEIRGAAKETLQLQIKERRTKGSAEIVYQILWPKERKGESVLLRKIGSSPATGFVFVPPDGLKPIGDLKDALFGSDLSYEDAIENFFAWDQQTLVGNEEVDGVSCAVLESKPGKAERSIYSKVKSWIDMRRLVPLRVEKYSGSGQVLRRVDTERVVVNAGRHIVANLVVTRGASSTALDGSRIRHNVAYTDRDFSAEALKETTIPRGTSE